MAQVEAFALHICGHTRLAAVLIAPVQRLMRYPMLLEALLSAIAKAEAKAEGHIAAIEFAAPRQRLTAAAERVAATAQQVNAMVTDAQNRCCVAEVHERVRGAAPGLIAPHRRLLLDAEIGGRKLEKKKGLLSLKKRAHIGIDVEQPKTPRGGEVYKTSEITSTSAPRAPRVE